MPAIVILTVGSQQPMHHPANRIILHLNAQVDVIGHQAVRIKVKRAFRFLALEQAQKLEVVIVFREYPLAIVPAADEMIKPASDFDSGLPGHSG